MVLKNDGEDKFDLSREERRGTTLSRGEEYHKYIKQQECNWIGHILRRNYLLNHVIEEKIET